MTVVQIEAFAIVAAMMALFVGGWLRYDVVAMLALLAALLLGVVPAAKGFSGFANPVIVIIASVLVVSRAIAQSNVLEAWVGGLLRRVKSTSLQVGILTAAVSYLSAFIKNVGTLGIFMPLAISTAQRSGRPRSLYLMPLAFGSLVGGTITKIGTSPNLLISSVREELGSPPFALFDFVAVGLPLTTLAVVFLAFGWRLLPHREGRKSAEEAFAIESYTTELTVPADFADATLTVGRFEESIEDPLTVAAIVREGTRRYVPSANWRIYPGDVLVVLADPTAVEKVVAKTGFQLVGARKLAAGEKTDEMEVAEVIVTPDSLLVGRTPATLELRHRFGINLFAVRTGDRATRTRLRAHRFAPGDVVLLQGWGKQLAASIAELGVLPLADRKLTLGRHVSGLVPLGLLAAALVGIGTGVVSVEAGFFAAAVLTIVLRQVSLKDAYEAVEWPVIVLLGCMIPVGEALKDTGAAALVGDVLTHAAAALPATLALGLVVAFAMLMTPLLHHAAAVLVLGPVAAALAHNLGYATDPFLMAVALGCACDFLTPIGHQNNTLVMGPGGYRFGDYWRLGLPLTLIVLVVGTPLIAWRWPLH
ncbi:MAG: anion permease [Proteobacteria bacterium]|nr:anion permease [Pseudomonadota bacterium]